MYKKLTAGRNPNWFHGKRVLITGGAGGLGIELTKRFKALGCEVILWDISEERLAKVAEKYRVRSYVVNLADQKSVEVAIFETLKNEGGVDILINNAGMVIGRPLLECDNSQIDDLIKVNVTSHHWTTKGFLPHMLEKKDGHIVTIASTMGSFAAAEMVPYCASKGGAVLFGEALRMELMGTGVSTSTIMPWHIDTAMFKGLGLPWITRLVTPTLKVEYVADQIVTAVKHKKRQVIMPYILWYIYLLRAVAPVWLFDIVAYRLGATTAMKTFAGRRVVPTASKVE